jgi:hypothetical protein
MSQSKKQKLFKINATAVVLAESIDDLTHYLTHPSDIWQFDESSDVTEIHCLSDLPRGWGPYSCPAAANKLYTSDPWANYTLEELLENIEAPKTAEERIAELEREVENLKQLINK